MYFKLNPVRSKLSEGHGSGESRPDANEVNETHSKARIRFLDISVSQQVVRWKKKGVEIELMYLDYVIALSFLRGLVATAAVIHRLTYITSD